MVMSRRADDDGRTITTRVAWGGFDDNRFRGHAVGGELAGHLGFWGQAWLGVGARRLTREEERFVDELSTCTVVADPRIWPLKVTRLVASYGRAMPAWSAGMNVLEGASVGPHGAGIAARMFQEVKARRDAREDGDLEAVAREMLAERGRLPGFGVPLRPRDERLPSVMAILRAHGRSDRPWTRLALDLEAATLAVRELPINVGGLLAAVLLDLDLSPAQLAAVSVVFAQTSYLANAFEGAEDDAPVMRRLPEDAVRYVGPAPRASGRAPRFIAPAVQPAFEAARKKRPA